MTPPTAAGAPADAATDLRLARLHLRMGQLGLARAELESLAGSGDLDDDGLLALAEARWRTGDLAGAGEAAQAYLEPGGSALVALVIVAESIAAAGRPGEARRVAGRALEQSEAPLDTIFAGMPRSSIWPADAAAGGAPSATLFGPDAPARSGARSEALPASLVPPLAHDGPGFWDADGGDAHGLPEPAAALDDARAALTAGRLTEGAVGLAIVLRLAPELAPAVLAATGDVPRRSAELELVRGDAFRLVGHELDARHAWSAAAAALHDDTDPHGRPQEES